MLRNVVLRLKHFTHVGIEPMNADDLYHHGSEAMERGALVEAVVLFRASIALWPHFKTLELLGECLLGLDQTREAIVPLAAATALHPSSRPPALLAQAYLALGQYQEAVHFAEEALARTPGDGQALETARVAHQHLVG
jgi:tetratricopeptide (TPR) repeat protein